MPHATLTDNEKKVLRAFWASEYADGQEQPDVWSFSLTQHAGLAPTLMGGVVASLVKKGLVDCHNFSAKSEDQYASPTADGFAAAVAAGLIFDKGGDNWKVTT